MKVPWSQPKPIFVFAANKTAADYEIRKFIQSYELQPKDLKYITRIDQLRGIRTCTIYMGPGWDAKRIGSNDQVLDFLENSTYVTVIYHNDYYYRLDQLDLIEKYNT